MKLFKTRQVDGMELSRFDVTEQQREAALVLANTYCNKAIELFPDDHNALHNVCAKCEIFEFLLSYCLSDGHDDAACKSKSRGNLLVHTRAQTVTQKYKIHVEHGNGLF